MQPLLSEATLMVVPNPFASPLDAKGNPVAFVAFDPEHLPRGTIRYIGSTLDREVKKARNIQALRDSGDQRQYSRVNTTIRHDLTPTPIVHSFYHQELVKQGALIAADEATAGLCGVKFVPPNEVVEESITTRIAEWCSDHPGGTLDPSAWTAPFGQTGKEPLLKGMKLVPRSAVTASTVEERIAAREADQKIREGDGLEKVEMPGNNLSDKAEAAEAMNDDKPATKLIDEAQSARSTEK